MPSSVALRLPAEARSVKRARDAVFALAELNEESCERARLVVSELVTNCLEHAGLMAGDAIDVRLDVQFGSLCGEVSSSGDGFDLVPVFVETDPRSDEGRGLRVVDRLVDRWGVQADGSTRVWFEIERH